MKKILLITGLIIVILLVVAAGRHFSYHPVCHGIDVSHHNNITSQVPPDAFKVLDSLEFIIAKATQGGGFVDGKYKKHREFSRKKGWKFGAYHFLTREHAVVSQFENFKNTVGRDIDIIPCLDIERYDGSHWGRREARNMLRQWNELCLNYYGEYPIVYCNDTYRIVYFGDMPNKFWINNWITKPFTDCVIHQYTSNSETLDYNYLPGAVEDILLSR